MKSSTIKTIGTWVVRVILGGFLLIAGQAKFTMSAIWGPKFTDWGYPDGFLYVVGALEIIAAIMIFIPKWSKWGAYLTGVIMIGAAITHLVNGEAREVLSPGIYMVLIAILLLLLRKKTVEAN